MVMHELNIAVSHVMDLGDSRLSVKWSMLSGPAAPVFLMALIRDFVISLVHNIVDLASFSGMESMGDHDNVSSRFG